MDDSYVSKILKDVLVKVLEHNNFEISPSLTASDIDGWDSLSHMLIIGEVEEAFSIKFKLRELNKMKNLGDLINLIKQKVGD